MTRHAWVQEFVFRDKTERQCAKCGLVKVTRHPPHGLPWTEFWRGLDRIICNGTPPCEGRAAGGVSEEAVT